MPLTIAATGLVTALGHDAATSCAAIRAGLTRAAPLPQCAVLDPDSQTLGPAIGHQVWGLTEGGSPVARWLALAGQAFADLCDRAALPGADDAVYWQRTALLLVGPALDDDRFVFCPPCNPELIDGSYVQPLLHAFGVPIVPARVHSVFAGRTGAMRAVQAARRLFEEAGVERVLVVAADSLLDGHSLAWLQETERLKAADQPNGLMPGEAGAAVLLQRQGAGGRVGAALDHREAAAPLADGRQHGRALGRVLEAALRGSGILLPFEGDLIVDLNGEAWRAYEFGAALTQVDRTVLGDCRTLLPAQSVGDIGAASAVAGLVVACTAFERHYASRDAAVVLSTSVDGKVGAMAVSAGQT